MRSKLIALAIGVGLGILLGAWVLGSYLALIFWQVDSILLPNILTIVAPLLLPLTVGVVVGYLSREWGWLLAPLAHVLRCVVLFPLTPILYSLLDRAVAAKVGLELGGWWELDITGSLVDLGWFTLLSGLGGLAGEILFFRGRGKQLAGGSELRQEDVEEYTMSGVLKWYFRPSLSAAIKIPVFLLFIGLTLWTLVADFRAVLWFLFAPPGSVGLLGFLHWLSLLLVPLPLLAFYEIWSPQRRLSKSLRWGLTVFVIPAWLVADVLLSAIGRLLGGGL